MRTGQARQAGSRQTKAPSAERAASGPGRPRAIGRAQEAARQAVAALLRRVPARVLAWLPVSVLRGLLVVALGRLPWALAVVIASRGIPGLLAAVIAGRGLPQLLAAVIASRGLPWLLCLALAAGCGVARDDAEALLARGQATAALRELEAEQAGNAHRDPAARARYALLRGLVHLSLADRVAAEWWLAQASEIVSAEPSCLDAADRARLGDAIQGLVRGP